MTESLLATIDDAAVALAVSPRTVRHLIQRGDLAPVIHIGRSVRIPMATLRAFVDARVADAERRTTEAETPVVPMGSTVGRSTRRAG